jgi:hypothetical protein
VYSLEYTEIPKVFVIHQQNTTRGITNTTVASKITVATV